MTVESKTETATATALKRERSASYPAYTVLQSLEFAEKINVNFSAASEVSREEIAHVLKTHPNTLSRNIASCVQFGFLEKNTSEGKYKLSPLFNDIIRPENEKDKKTKLLKAFCSPKLYFDLIEKFDNHVIPTEFYNTLIKHHDITEAASKNAAQIFIDSGKEVGVIGDNNVLKFSVTLTSVQKIQYAEVTDIPRHEEGLIPAKLENNIFEEQNASDIKKVPIYLTKNKIALFQYPSDINASDVAIVKHQLEGILLRITLEQEEEKNKGDVAPS